MELCDVIHEDTHTVLKLAKKKVIKQHAENAELNVIELFKELGIGAIPANVKQELVAWAWHADNFVVYQGFGLLEGKMDKDETIIKDVLDSLKKKFPAVIKNA